MSGHMPNENKLKSIQIISNENGKFILNDSALKEILSNELVRQRPIYIVSIIGSFRTGKSFLFSKFISYLTKKDTEGFEWSYGSSPHTKGIWMWESPILVKREDGNEICILLMDTQGTFDNETSQKECATIFSLSALMSSVQIYNIKNNIEKTHLEYLSLFAQYKKIAENFLCKQFRFEQLSFLVRDWQYPEEFEYGFVGGEKLLKKRLEYCENDLSLNEEIKELTKNLDFYFKNKNCFLMPHPGKSIIKKNFHGSLNELDKEFNEFCDLFFEQTIQNLIIDKSDSVRLNGESLFNMFKEYVEVLNGHNIPDIESIAKIYKKHNNFICIQNEILSYKNYFNKIIDVTKSFTMETQLINEHETILNESIERLKQNLIYIDDLEMNSELENLKRDLENLHNYFMQLNADFKRNFILKLQRDCTDKYEFLMKNVKKILNTLVTGVNL